MNIVLIFLISAIITFIKSLFQRHTAYNYYEIKLLNIIFTFLSVPQVRWGLSYVSFFLFLYIVTILSKAIGIGNIEIKSLLFTSMAISIYGIFLHVLFALASVLINQTTVQLLRNISIFWIILIFLFAFSKVTKLGLVKAAFLILIPAIPILLLIGITGIFPYLMWLTLS